jgi:outer membrane protein assembly factor BamE
MFLRVLAAVAVSLLVSCGSGRLSAPVVSPYRMEIQQGNFLTQEMVSQLKIGMSKDQVRFVLGTPLITDSFHADRWDYVFRRQKSGSKELERHKLAVFFEDGKLARIDTDVMPAASADPADIKTPDVKTPESKTEAPAAKPAAPAPKPEAQKPAPAAVPESKPAAPKAAEVPKPLPAATPEKSAATPEKPTGAAVPSADMPPEKKGWWDKVKDAVKF